MSSKNLSTITTTVNNNSVNNNHQLSPSISLSSNHSSPPKLQVKVNPYIPSKIIYNRILEKLPPERKQQIQQLKLLNPTLTHQQFIKLFLSKEKEIYKDQIEQEEFEKLQNIQQKWDPSKYKKKVLQPGDEDYKPPEVNKKYNSIDEMVNDYIYQDNCFTFKQAPNIQNIQDRVTQINIREQEEQTQLGLINKEIRKIIKQLFSKLAQYKYTDKTQIKVLDYTYPIKIVNIVFRLFQKQITIAQYKQQMKEEQNYLIQTITKFMKKPKPAEITINKHFDKINKINPDLIDKDIDKNKNTNKYYNLPNRTKQIERSKQHKIKCKSKYKINKFEKKMAKNHHKLSDYEKQMYEAYYDPMNYI